MKVENPDGISFLTQELEKHNPDNKLLVICIGPMHDLAYIPTKLYNNMSLWSMGGGFEESIDQFIMSDRTNLSVSRIGYNWGVCPEFTNCVLNKLTKSKTQVNLISSNLVRNKNVVMSDSLHKELMDLYANDETTIFHAIMRDWLYGQKTSALPQHKNLCDPLTVYLALKDIATCKTISLKSSINIESLDKYESYLDTNDDQMLVMTKASLADANTNLIYDFPDDVVDNLLKELHLSIFT